MKNIAYRIKLYLPTTLKRKLGKIKRRSLGILLSGNNFECPVCGKTFKKFLPAGVENRENAVCPGCDSFERHRLLWLYMTSKINFSDKEFRLLHFAPEDCLKEKISKLSNIKYVTTDLKEPHVSLNSDIQKLPFKNNQFDIIICSHVLEHIPDDKKGMQEILRVLKKNGWAILQVPINEDLEITYEDSSITSSLERLKHFGQEDHVRIYGRDYYKRLEEAGFIVERENFVKTLSKDKIRKYGLMENEIICHVTKPD
ncbi:MAG: methyltransferase domain-containing protein [Ignavibacteriaceae bacterium]